MSRIRNIKPGFFRSESLAECSRDARTTFQGLWCEADDAGRGVANAKVLCGAIWPLDDDITSAVVEDHLQQLAKTEHILLYEVDGKRYYAVLSWEKHISSAYRRGDPIYPPPPSDGNVQNPAPFVLEGKGREGKKEGKKEGKGSGTRKGGTPPPETFEITPALKDYAIRRGITVDLERETEEFLDWHHGHGSLWVDWNRAWQRWMRTAQDRADQRGQGRPQPPRVAVPSTRRSAADLRYCEECHNYHDEGEPHKPQRETIKLPGEQ